MNLAIAKALVMLLAVVRAILLRNADADASLHPGCGRIRRTTREPAPCHPRSQATRLGVFMALGVALAPERDASTLLTQAIVGAAGVCPIEV